MTLCIGSFINFISYEKLGSLCQYRGAEVGKFRLVEEFQKYFNYIHTIRIQYYPVRLQGA